MSVVTDSPAYFTRIGTDSFAGNDPARGPWSADHCHAGPVAGLVVRAAEAEIGGDKMLTRLTLDIVRPLPLAGLRVVAQTMRRSGTLATTSVEVRDLDGTLCVSGSTMHLTRRALPDVPGVPVDPVDFDGAAPGTFPIPKGLHGKPAFSQFIDIRYPPGHGYGPGAKTLWMKTPPLLADEEPSPIQSLCALADCGNGISWNAPPESMGFMNTDLTLQVHREPGSDWLASEAVSHWHGTGIGMSQAILHDRSGPVATALQTLVLFPPRP